MTRERWQQIEELYNAARERAPESRSAFLVEACGGDEDLRRAVQGLLDQDSGGEFLKRPAEELLPESIARPAMLELKADSSLGQYRIREHLGQGGMGTVYKATDTKLGREVALKLLRPEMLDDAANVARFEREARTLASLNHPHIAAIYDLEEHEGVRFLALEYVPGPTLADRLKRGPLPITEALGMAAQVARALEAAHAKGIMHRDLKPANIKVPDKDPVKVLDFGLAKPVERPKAVSPDATTVTLTENLTKAMTIVGTPAYMSPEQASGKELDARTDIWSFGCVLYEALSGKRAFRGSTVTETLAAVLEREPDWPALPASAPVALVLLLKRCLRKDPNARLRDIGDARIELEDLFAPAVQEVPVGKPTHVTRRTAISALAGAAIGAAATGVFAINRYRGAAPRKLTQFIITPAEGDYFVASFGRRIVISPDGTHLAYVLVHGPLFNWLNIHALSDLKPRLAVDSGGFPFFSPDGRWVAFNDPPKETLRKVGLDGGAPSTICSNVGSAGGTWTNDDVIYYVSENPGNMVRVSAAGGQPVDAAALDFRGGERQHKTPYALPGGKAILLTVPTVDAETFDDAHIVVFSPATGQRKVLVEGGTDPSFSPSGHLVYGRGGKLYAVRFDPQSLKVSGQAFPVLDGVLMSRNTGIANYSISASGDLAYIPGVCEGGARTLVWVDRNGKTEAMPLPAKSYLHPRLSPDDRRLAIEVEGPSHNLYVYDFARGVLADITTDGVSHWPVWSPDGTQLGYRSGPMGHFTLWHVPADRSGAPQQVPATGVIQSAESWSPDGHTIAYTASAPGVPPSIMAARLDGNHQAELVDKEKAPVGSPKFSPDGRWLAYCSNESGKPQVYVQAFPGPGAKIQVSSDGGTDPVWKRKGGELYYRNVDSMMAVTVSTSPGFSAGRPLELWKGHYSHGMSSSCGPPGTTSSNYDVTTDGKRFLMIKDDDQDRATSKQIVVVLGWADDVGRMAAKA